MQVCIPAVIDFSFSPTAGTERAASIHGFSGMLATHDAAAPIASIQQSTIGFPTATAASTARQEKQQKQQHQHQQQQQQQQQQTQLQQQEQQHQQQHLVS